MTKKTIHILSIESSCDDTGAAVLENNRVLSNVIAGQKIHAAYGGVVPELASRAHQQNIVPVVDQALKQAGISKKELHGIAFTKGPGLMGSLLVGTSFAKSLSIALDIPLIPVNHMQAHVLAHFIEDKDHGQPPYPFLCMTISGGHTQILKVNAFNQFEILGQTIDDAVGEAFDKTAKLLGLPYPGGPLIDKYAKLGNPLAFSFSEPKTRNPLDFSFSGLKTAILYFLQREQAKDPNFIKDHLHDICASVQRTIVMILMKRLKKAAAQTNIKHVAIAGGVSANSEIRSTLKRMESELGWSTYIPKFEYTTDNAAMIGIVGYFKYLNKDFGKEDTTATSRLGINES